MILFNKNNILNTLYYYSFKVIPWNKLNERVCLYMPEKFVQFFEDYLIVSKIYSTSFI